MHVSKFYYFHRAYAIPITSRQGAKFRFTFPHMNICIKLSIRNIIEHA